jgi:hypothetical protein
MTGSGFGPGGRFHDRLLKPIQTTDKSATIRSRGTGSSIPRVHSTFILALIRKSTEGTAHYAWWWYEVVIFGVVEDITKAYIFVLSGSESTCSFHQIEAEMREQAR